MNGKHYKLKTIQLIVMLLVSITLVVIVISPLTSYEKRIDQAETERILQTVEKYALQCYATEGAYPPNIQYLSEHYGLILNEDKYIYEFEPVAENIRPNIQIFIRLDYDQ